MVVQWWHIGLGDNGYPSRSYLAGVELEHGLRADGNPATQIRRVVTSHWTLSRMKILHLIHCTGVAGNGSTQQ